MNTTDVLNRESGRNVNSAKTGNTADFGRTVMSRSLPNGKNLFCSVNSKHLMLMVSLIFLLSCQSGRRSGAQNSADKKEKKELAEAIEQSLFEYVINPWYPRCLDTVYGGYISNFDHDWKLSEGSQDKALVHQSRHIWTTAFLYEYYPEHEEFLEYAAHGFRFLKSHYLDKETGGFFYSCTREGEVDSSSIDYKKVYGQAFAINGLAQYYKVSGDPEALQLAKETFHWMDRNARDKTYGGYFENLNRDGTPEQKNVSDKGRSGDDPLTGLKEFNSSLHILEAFTELYMVWPDSLLRVRLEEMYHIFRDIMIHPDGHLILYFYPDWTPVPADEMREISGDSYWFTQHITFGHDVETAFLLHEAAHVLGMEDDEKMQNLAKNLVDHSLDNGWDNENGGFYYIGYKENGKTTIHVDHKAFWVESEGLNALMLMHTLYPSDERNYFSYAEKMWNYIDSYLVDKEHGGWYNYGLDTYPENKTQKKSHNWKATYHDVRGMVRSIKPPSRQTAPHH